MLIFSWEWKENKSGTNIYYTSCILYSTVTDTAAARDMGQPIYPMFVNIITRSRDIEGG